jgi:hypothetical protein
MTGTLETGSRCVQSSSTDVAKEAGRLMCPVHKTKEVASTPASGAGRLSFVLLEASTYESGLESFVRELSWLEGRPSIPTGLM